MKKLTSTLAVSMMLFGVANLGSVSVKADYYSTGDWNCYRK